MRNRCCQLILLMSPFMLWAACITHPVIDDWTYITIPQSDHFSNWDFLKARGNQWRPFDGIYGQLLGYFPALFPWVNHILIVLAHVMNTLLVWHIGNRLKFNQEALCIATFIFFLSPAMCATVLNTDSLNQVFSQLWGLTGLYIFLKLEGKKKYILWCITLLMATFSKENGLMWTFTTPLIAWGFEQIDTKKLKSSLWVGIGVICLYFLFRFSITEQILQTNSAYVTSSFLRYMRGLAMFIGYSFIPVDYISIVYPPSRNVLLILITAMLSIPFILMSLKGSLQTERKKFFTLLTAIILLALPHLLTIFTALHSYAALAACSWLIAFVSSEEKNKKRLWSAFALYMTAIIITTGHHWVKSVESGNTGKEMAQEIIQKSTRPANKVVVFIREDHSPNCSSFCAKPCDAFGWGRAVWDETNFEWPKALRDETIPQNISDQEMQLMTDQVLREGADAVWLINGKKTTVIEKNPSSF